jgi:hypothetical protein
MWTFAVDRATLGPTADTPEWGEGYVFTLPDQWIMVYRVFRRVNTQDPSFWPQAQWSLEGRKIIANVDTVYAMGLRRVTDPGQFSTLFTQALAARLAADAAIPLTQNRQTQIDMWNLYNDKLEAAAARDGQQGRNERIRQRGLTGVRQAGGYVARGVW